MAPSELSEELSGLGAEKHLDRERALRSFQQHLRHAGVPISSWRVIRLFWQQSSLLTAVLHLQVDLLKRCNSFQMLSRVCLPVLSGNRRSEA